MGVIFTPQQGAELQDRRKVARREHAFFKRHWDVSADTAQCTLFAAGRRMDFVALLCQPLRYRADERTLNAQNDEAIYSSFLLPFTV